MSSALQLRERPHLRGDLAIVAHNTQTGREHRMVVRNTITYSGLNSALYLWAQNVGIAPTDYQMTTLVPGTNATPPTRGDLSVVSPVPLADYITLTDGDRVISPASGELVISGTLGVGNANGLTLCEVGLVLGNGDLFARQVHPAFQKTNVFTLTYTWRIAMTA